MKYWNHVRKVISLYEENKLSKGNATNNGEYFCDIFKKIINYPENNKFNVAHHKIKKLRNG